MSTAVIVFDPLTDAVLLSDADPPGPLVVPSDEQHPPMDHTLAVRVREATGISTAVLDPVDFRTAVVETLTPAPAAPAGFRWCERARAADIDEPCRNWVHGYQDRIEPWFRPGWYARASAYLDRVAAGQGRVRTGPVEQVKHWSMSSVLRAHTDGARLYLKAILPELAHEPAVIGLLARSWPDAVPRVLAGDPAEHWWVAADFGGTSGLDLPEADVVDCLPLMVAVQHGLVGRVSELRAVGCLDRRLAAIATAIPPLLARDDLWRAPQSARNRNRALSVEERGKLAELGPVLLECCALLDALDIPDTLVHGDFHRGNVVRTGNAFVIFDWSFAAVGNPLFDLASWIFDASDDAANQYIRTYLDEWRRRGVTVDWETAWRLAKPLSAVIEIMKFVRLADIVGPDHAFNWLAITYGWVRRLLNAVRDESGAIAGWRK